MLLKSYNFIIVFIYNFEFLMERFNGVIQCKQLIENLVDTTFTVELCLLRLHFRYDRRTGYFQVSL